MTEISAMFVRKQVSEARNVSDKAKLFALVGLTEESARAPDAKIKTADYFTLLEKIAESEWPRSRSAPPRVVRHVSHSASSSPPRNSG